MDENPKDVTPHQIQLLKRFVRGKCPPISSRVFHELCELPGMPNALQRESASGADTSDGYILTNLHGMDDRIDDGAAVKQWLIERGHLEPDHDEQKPALQEQSND